MTALYQWHPYELQAMICGVVVGVPFGIVIGMKIYERIVRSGR